MKDYFMVSECSGDLFDTRKPGWHKLPALRPAYGKIVDYFAKQVDPSLAISYSRVTETKHKWKENVHH